MINDSFLDAKRHADEIKRAVAHHDACKKKWDAMLKRHEAEKTAFNKIFYSGFSFTG